MDFSTRERGIAQYTSAVHAIDGLRSVSARAAPLLFIGRRALPRSQGEHAPVTRSGVGWTFRLGTRWASGQSEGAGWRAGTHPRLRQQGPEPARRGAQRQEEEQAPKEQAPRRSIGKCARCRFRSGAPRWRCVASVHARFCALLLDRVLGGRGVPRKSLRKLFVPHYVFLRGLGARKATPSRNS